MNPPCTTNKSVLKNYIDMLSHPSQNCYHQKYKKKKCWGGCEEKGALIHCWYEYKLVQPVWKSVWWFLKTLKMITLITPHYIPKGIKVSI
jgi:hypothetical protein